VHGDHVLYLYAHDVLGEPQHNWLVTQNTLDKNSNKETHAKTDLLRNCDAKSICAGLRDD
jgi:hypothetical protein